MLNKTLKSRKIIFKWPSIKNVLFPITFTSTVNNYIILLLTLRINLYKKSFIIDIIGILLIYFLPEISQLLNIPVYLFEPMRVIIVVAMVHSSRNNAYLLAFLLPLISLILSNHPSVIKTFILSGDLLLNIFLFFSLIKFKVNKFLLMSMCIFASKLAYYLAKYFLIEFSVLKGELIATPLYIQMLIVIILSGYVYIVDKSFTDHTSLTIPKS